MTISFLIFRLGHREEHLLKYTYNASGFTKSIVSPHPAALPHRGRSDSMAVNKSQSRKSIAKKHCNYYEKQRLRKRKYVYLEKSREETKATETTCRTSSKIPLAWRNWDRTNLLKRLLPSEKLVIKYIRTSQKIDTYRYSIKVSRFQIPLFFLLLYLYCFFNSSSATLYSRLKMFQLLNLF